MKKARSTTKIVVLSAGLVGLLLSGPGWVDFVYGEPPLTDAGEPSLNASLSEQPNGAVRERRTKYAAQVLNAYCVDCHSNDLAEAGFNIEELLADDQWITHRFEWERIGQVVEMGAMPPAEMDQPREVERDNLLAVLDAEITQFDYSDLNIPGHTLAARLTHRQYDNTVRDLFGIDLKPTSTFPAEMAGMSGFDNSANTLFLQSSLMERYIAAAEGIVARALPEERTTEGHEQAYRTIFVVEPGEGRSEASAANAVLTRFLRRAYRRTPQRDEIQAIAKLYRGSRDAGYDHEASIRRCVTAVLISPKFLMRLQPALEGDDPSRVDGWELASRLSYFLWASMPDEELFELAANGEIHEPEVLVAQVERMLKDPKANELGEVFASQWFSTKLIGSRIRYDPIDNPWCTDSLMAAMRDETAMFFVSLLRENRPVADLVAADYTYMNEELASTLYRVDGVVGDQMRRVPLNDPNRGGILGQPAVLAVTSGHFSTNPIKRGIFVLETLLGSPPPPPPANAGEISDEIRRKRGLSFREKLGLHSDNASCKACHEKIDPLGFALENFDYFGRWRDTYGRGKEIDNSAQLPTGGGFTGAAGLKEYILASRHDELVRQVSSKMLSYALGRQLEYYDEPALREIESRLEADQYRFQTLLKAVVESFPFRHRSQPISESPS